MIACGWIMSLSFDFLASGQMSLPFVPVWLEPQTLRHDPGCIAILVHSAEILFRLASCT